MSFAHQQLRSFVDRVLTLKKEQDKLGEDIKQVYAEAHAARFDKTAMGKVVNHLRRHAKAGSKARIADVTFEEYLDAYEHGTALANIDTHTHAREALPPHDEDGVIIEEPARVPSQAEAGQEGVSGPSSVAPPTNPQVSANGPMTALAPGAEGEPLKDDVAGAGSFPPRETASPIISDAQHGMTDKPASPVPAASTGPASSEEPYAYGSGEVQDRVGASTSQPLSPSASPSLQAEQPSGIEPRSLPEGAPIIDLTLPPIFKRGDPNCIVKVA